MMTTTYETKNEMTVCWGWLNKKIVLPKGTEVELASNLPEGSGFWLVDLPAPHNECEEAVGWHEVYGILIRPEDVQEA